MCNLNQSRREPRLQNIAVKSAYTFTKTVTSYPKFYTQTNFTKPNHLEFFKILFTQIQMKYHSVSNHLSLQLCLQDPPTRTGLVRSSCSRSCQMFPGEPVQYRANWSVQLSKTSACTSQPHRCPEGTQLRRLCPKPQKTFGRKVILQ